MEPHVIFIDYLQSDITDYKFLKASDFVYHSNTSCPLQYFYKFLSLDVSILSRFKLKQQIKDSDPFWKPRADTTLSEINFVQT